MRVRCFLGWHRWQKADYLVGWGSIDDQTNEWSCPDCKDWDLGSRKPSVRYHALGGFPHWARYSWDNMGVMWWGSVVILSAAVAVFLQLYL